MKDVVLRFTHIVSCILLPFYRLSMGSIGASLMAQMVKNLPAMWDTWVWEDPLEKGMAIHSSILAWRIPWTEEPCGLRVGHD